MPNVTELTTGGLVWWALQIAVVGHLWWIRRWMTQRELDSAAHRAELQAQENRHKAELQALEHKLEALKEYEHTKRNEIHAAMVELRLRYVLKEDYKGELQVVYKKLDSIETYLRDRRNDE